MATDLKLSTACQSLLEPEESSAPGGFGFGGLLDMLMTTTSAPDLCAAPGQCVVYKGYEYRTLDGTFPDSNSAGYQDYWLPLPDGWEIAPWEEDVRVVAEGHPWGAHRIVHSSTTREHCSCTPLYTSCECSWGSGRVYGTRTVDNVTEYKTNHNDRILIRRASGTTTRNPSTSISSTHSFKLLPAVFLKLMPRLMLNASATASAQMGMHLQATYTRSLRVTGHANGTWSWDESSQSEDGGASCGSKLCLIFFLLHIP